MATPLAENLIDRLHEVSDLDVLRQCYSNAEGDQACPWLGGWVIELANAEQTARDAPGGAELDYRIIDTAELTFDALNQAVAFAMGVARLAENVRTDNGRPLPTVAGFAWAMLQTLVVELQVRLGTEIQRRAAA